MKTLSQIKDELATFEITKVSTVLDLYRFDKRIGVQKLVQWYEKKLENYQTELQRINNLSLYEQQQYKKGNIYIAGIDEVGRGPLAGPVLTSAVILPKDCIILGINDSKKLSSAKREELYIKIKEKALALTISMIDVETIDNINILQATIRAMQQSIEKLNIKPDTILVDALKIPNIKINQISIIRGDTKSITIGAASIVAKVTRDSMMKEFHKLYPEYGFDRNKGYGTQEHIEAIKKYGLCPIHRKTFVKNFL